MIQRDSGSFTTWTVRGAPLSPPEYADADPQRWADEWAAAKFIAGRKFSDKIQEKAARKYHGACPDHLTIAHAFFCRQLMSGPFEGWREAVEFINSRARILGIPASASYVTLDREKKILCIDVSFPNF